MINLIKETAADKFVNSLIERLPQDYFCDYEIKESFEESQDIYEFIDSLSIKVKEIVYYSNAMDYLRRNDPGLQYCLQLAYDMGYTLKNLNSELLANLLLFDNTRDELYDLLSHLETEFEEAKSNY